MLLRTQWNCNLQTDCTLVATLSLGCRTKCSPVKFQQFADYRWGRSRGNEAHPAKHPDASEKAGSICGAHSASLCQLLHFAGVA